MKLLITGGCGFLGSNLAQHALENGYELCIFDNLSRVGSQLNLEWLSAIGKFTFFHGDIRNQNDVDRLIIEFRPEMVFHLAGQVAMTTSIASPRYDFEVNALGSLNLLESIRKYSPDALIIYSSTNKVYGDLEQYKYSELETRWICEDYPEGFDESVPLDFHSPYGCSKGAADQYFLDYNRIYGIKTVVFRHSSMYGGRQFATVDQGWIGWFCQKAIEAEKGTGGIFSISGSGKQVRDVLHCSDMINIYFSATERMESLSGTAFNIGGGIENSLSILELISLLEGIVGCKLNYKKIDPRVSDQRVFVANTFKAKSEFDWVPVVSALEGIEKMLSWIKYRQ